MIPKVSLREALDDPALLGHAIAGDSWKPWRALLIAAMGEALTDDERRLFTQLTGREHEPLQPVEEFVGVVGRRGARAEASACWSRTSQAFAIIQHWCAASVASC